MRMSKIIFGLVFKYSTLSIVCYFVSSNGECRSHWMFVFNSVVVINDDFTTCSYQRPSLSVENRSHFFKECHWGGHPSNIDAMSERWSFFLLFGTTFPFYFQFFHWFYLIFVILMKQSTDGSDGSVWCNFKEIWRANYCSTFTPTCNSVLCQWVAQL